VWSRHSDTGLVGYYVQPYIVRYDGKLDKSNGTGCQRSWFSLTYSKGLYVIIDYEMGWTCDANGKYGKSVHKFG
jgi:hypothetical protein